MKTKKLERLNAPLPVLEATKTIEAFLSDQFDVPMNFFYLSSRKHDIVSAKIIYAEILQNRLGFRVKDIAGYFGGINTSNITSLVQYARQRRGDKFFRIESMCHQIISNYESVYGNLFNERWKVS